MQAYSVRAVDVDDNVGHQRTAQFPELLSGFYIFPVSRLKFAWRKWDTRNRDTRICVSLRHSNSEKFTITFTTNGNSFNR